MCATVRSRAGGYNASSRTSYNFVPLHVKGTILVLMLTTTDGLEAYK